VDALTGRYRTDSREVLDENCLRFHGAACGMGLAPAAEQSKNHAFPGFVGWQVRRSTDAQAPDVWSVIRK
jgi:hypothetical protein